MQLRSSVRRAAAQLAPSKQPSVSQRKKISTKATPKKTAKKTKPPKRASSGATETPALKVETLGRGFELALVEQGYNLPVGVDEAGRGPLAGPVVTAACHVPLDVTIEGINDSKKIDENMREELFEKLTTNPRVLFSTCIVDHKRIDEINILQATLEGMRKCVEKITGAEYACIDGNRMPKEMPVPAEVVVKGDSKVYNIAAASVIAKVTRDRLMLEYHERWPQYNFAQHKGYPTGAHMSAVHKYGPCPIHRLTFAPLKHMDLDKWASKKESSSKEAEEPDIVSDGGISTTTADDEKKQKSKKQQKKPAAAATGRNKRKAGAVEDKEGSGATAARRAGGRTSTAARNKRVKP